MALQERQTTQHGEGAGQGRAPNIWDLLEHMRERPLIYVIGAVFVVVAIVIGVIVRVQRQEAQRADATALAEALDAETPDAQLAALEAVISEADAVEAEALYLKGEKAYRLGEFDTARTAFERLRLEYPQFQFTPDAVEGLGYIEEEEENYEAALNIYQEIMDKWPESFAARRQPNNKGRVLEKLGRYEEAVTAYQSQIEVFPNSAVAFRAEQALDTLRQTHAERFEAPEAALPEDLPEAPGIPPIEIAPQEPAPEAPAEAEAPAEDASQVGDVEEAAPEAEEPPGDETPAGSDTAGQP